MRGRIVSNPTPADDHHCRQPGWWVRWNHGLKEGAIWQCDKGSCRRMWRLSIRYVGYGDREWWWQPVVPDAYGQWLKLTDDGRGGPLSVTDER